MIKLFQAAVLGVILALALTCGERSRTLTNG